MRKFPLRNWILLLVFGLFTSSCFDILEEYEFNADGSGKAKMVIDVAGMMDMMASFSAMDSTGEAAKSMEDMFTDNATVENLKLVAGISNVKSLSNKEEKIVGFSYDFASLEALNNGLAASSQALDFASIGMDVGSSMESESGNYFVRKGKKLTRVMDMSSEDKGDDGDAEAEQYAEMAKMMFADAKYEVRYSFANGVKKVKKNSNAVVGPDGRTVSITASLIDLMDKKAEMGCEIILK